MEAVGMIETSGLIAAIEAADAMVKAANVTLINRTKVGGGLVVVVVTGDVGAVKAAVEAGTSAASRVGTVCSTHVIPRPINEIGVMLGQINRKKGAGVSIQQGTEKKAGDTPPPLAEGTGILPDETAATLADEEKVPSEPLNNGEMAKTEYGDTIPTDYEKLKVTELRSLLRKVEGVPLSREEIKFANRETLIRVIRTILEQQNQ